MPADQEQKYSPKSPGMMFLTIATAIFTAEAFVMLILSYLPDHSVWTGAILNATLLLLLISPTLYFFLLRPMISYIREHQKIEDTLRKNEEK